MEESRGNGRRPRGGTRKSRRSDLGRRRAVAKASNRKKSRRSRNRGRRVPKKQQSGDPKQIIDRELRSAFKYDLRGPNAVGPSVISRLVQPTTPITVVIDPVTFQGIIASVVSYALQKGWSVFTRNDDYVYWAFVYQVNLLQQAALGGIPETGVIPYWLSLLYQAVVKKEVKYRGGYIAYNFTIDANNQVPPDHLLVGPPVYSKQFTLGVKSIQTVNNTFPVMTGAAAYTKEAGLKATQQLWQYLSDHDLVYSYDEKGNLVPRTNPMHEMVDALSKNVMTNDVSAYAFFDQLPGGGFNNSGAWFKPLYNEVTVTRPIFSVFTPLIQNRNFLNRSRVKLRLFSGDAFTLGGLLVSLGKKDYLSVKTPIVIKYINFYDFFEVYARTLLKAAHFAVTDSDFGAALANNPNYVQEVLQVPLTMQEFMIIMRASLMSVFTETSMAQGTYPRSAATAQANEFVVFPCGVNTYSMNIANTMLWPSMMVENVQSLRSRARFNGKGGNRNPIYTMAALGAFAKDVYSPDSFVIKYTVGENTFSVPLFRQDQSEVHIDIIDGHFTDNSGGYACINDTVAISKLSAIFNQYVQNRSDYLRDLSPISPTVGNPGLVSVGMTAHWTEDTSLEWKEEKVSTKRMVQKRFSDTILGTPSDKRSLITVSSAFSPIDEVWTGFQQFFVLPFNKFTGNSLNNTSNTFPLVMSPLLREPQQIPVAAGSVGFPTLGDRWDNYASLMVKNKFSKETQQEIILKKFEEDGQGGLLGQLASAVTASIGHPLVDVGARLLSQAVPI